MESQGKNGGPNFLREWREDRGMTQSQLAEMVGTNANMIGYLESGERGLSAKWLRKLAIALDTSSGAILDYPPGNQRAKVHSITDKIDERYLNQAAAILEALASTGTGGPK